MEKYYLLKGEGEILHSFWEISQVFQGIKDDKKACYEKGKCLTMFILIYLCLFEQIKFLLFTKD